MFGDDRQFFPLLKFNQIAEGLTGGRVVRVDVDDVVLDFGLPVGRREKQRNV